ncbi:MAG: hypothetical protein WD768_01765 [Phycisphaeraceae bacterium]
MALTNIHSTASPAGAVTHAPAGDAGSEHVLHCDIEEVEILRRAGLLDVLAREEVAVAELELGVLVELVADEQVDLRADLAGEPGACETERRAARVVARVGRLGGLASKPNASV